MPIKVDAGRCMQDHKCPTVAICPAKALSQEGCRAPGIDADKCDECLECTFFCPNGVFTCERETTITCKGDRPPWEKRKTNLP